MTNQQCIQPMCRVILHPTDVASMTHVVRALRDVFDWTVREATEVMMAARRDGIATCGSYPKEHAELVRYALQSHELNASIKPEAVIHTT